MFISLGPSDVAVVSFLCYDGCHKKQIELSVRGIKGQTHPVRRRLVVSHREGLGVVTC